MLAAAAIGGSFFTAVVFSIAPGTPRCALMSGCSAVHVGSSTSTWNAAPWRHAVFEPFRDGPYIFLADVPPDGEARAAFLSLGFAVLAGGPIYPKYFPLWPPLIAACLIELWLSRRRTKRDWSKCAGCGYDAAGIPDVCPECGRAVRGD